MTLMDAQALDAIRQELSADTEGDMEKLLSTIVEILAETGRTLDHDCCDHIYDSYCPCCMEECEAWENITEEQEQ